MTTAVSKNTPSPPVTTVPRAEYRISTATLEKMAALFTIPGIVAAYLTSPGMTFLGNSIGFGALATNKFQNEEQVRKHLILTIASSALVIARCLKDPTNVLPFLPFITDYYCPVFQGANAVVILRFGYKKKIDTPS
jgi:hypothetical protein